MGHKRRNDFNNEAWVILLLLIIVIFAGFFETDY